MNKCRTCGAITALIKDFNEKWICVSCDDKRWEEALEEIENETE